MLENDIVLERFLASRGAAITDDEVAMLDRLLDLTDNDLWDLIAGRVEADDVSLAPDGARAARLLTAVPPDTRHARRFPPHDVRFRSAP